jgi:hypothetical protein
MSSGGGCWVSAQLALMGGKRERGAGAGQIPITCPGSQGTLCPCFLLMIRVDRTWNSPAVANGP